MERMQGGSEVVRGTSRRVVVVKSPDPRVFEEAIFIVREDFISRGGIDSEKIMQEAVKAANDYLRVLKQKKKKSSLLYRLPAPFIAAAGAAATGIAWLAVKLMV